MTMYLIKVLAFPSHVQRTIIIIIELFAISNSIPDAYRIIIVIVIFFFRFCFTFALNSFDFDAKNIEFHYYMYYVMHWLVCLMWKINLKQCK